MRNIIAVLKMPIIIILTLLLQIIISNNFNIFGITPNVILVMVVILSMWNDIKVNIIISGIMGILADLIFKFSLGSNVISYIVISVVVSYISKKYRRDSKAAIVYITMTATIIFTLLQLVYYVIDTSLIVNIFSVIKEVIVQILLNISIAYILYKIFESSIKDRELNSVYR